MNYPVLRQNKRVLLNTFVKKHCLKSHHCTIIREARRDRQMECTQRSNRDCGFLRTYTIRPLHPSYILLDLKELASMQYGPFILYSPLCQIFHKVCSISEHVYNVFIRSYERRGKIAQNSCSKTKMTQTPQNSYWLSGTRNVTQRTITTISLYRKKSIHLIN